MAATLHGPTDWRCTRDQDGNREYKIKFRVKCAKQDGPYAALTCPGLPLPGDMWDYDNDSDPWAFCKQNAEVIPVTCPEPNKNFDVTFTFSTKSDEKRCKDQSIEDPLLIPQQVSGSFVKYQEEAVLDKDGVMIVNSGWEGLHGSQAEWDRNRPTVKIQQNVPSLQLGLCASMIDTVNDSSLWGVGARCIKLSNFSWERKFYGNCYVYYSRTFEFDIRYESFDRIVLDEGTKVLHGHWEDSAVWQVDAIGDPPLPPNPNNPAHFDRFKDRNGENCTLIYNNDPAFRGQPVDSVSPTASQLLVQKYTESNFLLLGIPTSF